MGKAIFYGPFPQPKTSPSQSLYSVRYGRSNQASYILKKVEIRQDFAAGPSEHFCLEPSDTQSPPDLAKQVHRSLEVNALMHDVFTPEITELKKSEYCI